MSIETVKCVAAQFLAQREPGVLAIKGRWGVGKTFAWDAITKQYKTQITAPRYSYVSLFGVSSISDLRLAVVANQLLTTQIGETWDVATVLNEDIRRLGPKAAAWLGRLASSVPYTKNVTVGLEALAPYFIKDALVCFDDFERLADSQLTAEQVLGYVSHLREHRRCKVVIIFNDGELSTAAREAYAKYREKVIDVEVAFAPTIDEAIGLGVPMETPWRGEVIERVRSLEVTNIRLLRKLSRYITDLYSNVVNPHPAVVTQIVFVVTLFVYCLYTRGKPSFEFLRRWQAVAWQMRQKEKPAEITPEEAGWAKLLNEYGYFHTDELDLALMRYVERGYLQESGVGSALQTANANAMAQQGQESFSDLWSRLFHNTFANNEGELVDALAAGLRTNAKFVTPINMNGTICLLRELKRDELADELVEEYIKAHRDEAPVFALDGAFGGEINDPLVRRRFAEEAAKLHKDRTLKDAVERIADTEGWHREDLDIMLNASEQDYYDVLKTTHGDTVRRLVKRFLSFDHDAQHKQIADRARAALGRIGTESRVNELRVRRFGIEPGK